MPPPSHTAAFWGNLDRVDELVRCVEKEFRQWWSGMGETSNHSDKHLTTRMLLHGQGKTSLPDQLCISLLARAH